MPALLVNHDVAAADPRARIAERILPQSSRCLAPPENTYVECERDAGSDYHIPAHTRHDKHLPEAHAAYEHKERPSHCPDDA